MNILLLHQTVIGDEIYNQLQQNPNYQVTYVTQTQAAISKLAHSEVIIAHKDSPYFDKLVRAIHEDYPYIRFGVVSGELILTRETFKTRAGYKINANIAEAQPDFAWDPGTLDGKLPDWIISQIDLGMASPFEIAGRNPDRIVLDKYMAQTRIAECNARRNPEL